jgi:sulfate adenylyltransferase (ADP) / ATP adenylyltransferase
MLEREEKGRENILLKPGTLWKRTSAQTDYALSCGALYSFPTDYQFIEQDGITFIVRILLNLKRKEEATKQQQEKNKISEKEFNPFLPYEEDLFVADISETHVCILNKYNVVPHHLLIITRDFEEQDSWLTIRDFEAMRATLAEIDGLFFYNGGKAAGASQRHKHLQLVPFIANNTSIPIVPALLNAQFQDSIGKIPAFPFIHAFTKLDAIASHSAEATLECYQKLLEAVGLPVEGKIQTGAYNLLATREWMLIVARSQESFQSIAVNSLGFAGALLVRDEEQLEILKQNGPMTILRNVARFD